MFALRYIYRRMHHSKRNSHDHAVQLYLRAQVVAVARNKTAVHSPDYPEDGKELDRKRAATDTHRHERLPKSNQKSHRNEERTVQPLKKEETERCLN
jgi:hypothetical protein